MCGYHPPSGFLFAISQLPSEMIILSEPWPIEAEAPPSTCLIQNATAFPLCDGTTPNPTWCHSKLLSICNVALLLFGEENNEKGAAPSTLQSRCEGGKTHVLIGPRLHGILQTQQKSQLSLTSGRFMADHAIEFTKPRSRMHYSTLYNLKMANNGVEPGTSATAFMRTFPMPTPHVNCGLSSVILRVFSIVHSRNWVGSVALDLLCGRAYSPAHQDKSSWAAVSCPLAIEGVQSQTELLPWLWLKKVGKFPRHDEANE